MVNQHAFGFPLWYVDEISYPLLLPYVKQIARFCAFALVPIFLFLTGYTYYYHKNKSLNYSLSKIITFLLDYWLIYSILLFSAHYLCGYNVTLVDSLKEMFSVSGNVMIFNWYVFCYIEVMFFLPLLHKIITIYNKKKAIFIILTIFLFMEGTGFALYLAGMKGTFIYKITGSYFIKHVSMATIGYYFAYANILPRLYSYLKKYNRPSLLVILLLCVLIYQYQPKTTYLITPLYVVVMYSLKINMKNPINKIVLFLAQHSMNIWFLHCIFWATATRELFQKYAYLPQYPIFVVMWVLFLCSMISIIITPIQKIFSNKIVGKHRHSPDPKF